MADASSTVLSQILRKRRLDDSKSSAVGRCSPPRKDFAIPTHYFEPAKLTRQLLILHEHFPQLAAAVLSLVKSNLSQDEARWEYHCNGAMPGGTNFSGRPSCLRYHRSSICCCR
uniref:Uncharacterized protein n=1 Tax=Ascaris lumbricoides TaxID=6252 RepID=A0A9J2Q9P7_ASCLU